MNRFLILFFFIGMSVQAQTTPFTVLYNGNKPAFTNQDTATLTKPMLLSNTTMMNRYIEGSLIFANNPDGEKKEESTDNTTIFSWLSATSSGLLSNYNINDHALSATDARVINNGYRWGSDFLTSANVDQGHLDLLLAHGLPPVTKPVKPTYTDYVDLPNGKNGLFEFHDHEATTISGTIVDISTTSLTAFYSNTQPATITNGADIVQHGIYQETTYGAGNVPWYIATAPSNASGPSIDLNTSSNLLPLNDQGAFNINTPDGNSFQMSTGDKGGLIGWVRPNSNTALTLSAGVVYVPGQLSVDGNVSSKLGIAVGERNSSSIIISPGSITFTNSRDANYIGSGLTIGGDGILNEAALLLESRGHGGILLDASADAFGEGASITFAINSNIVGRFTNDGFETLRLTDEQIFSIPNPKEGKEVWSLDHHIPAYYNGTKWIFCDCAKTIK